MTSLSNCQLSFLWENHWQLLITILNMCIHRQMGSIMGTQGTLVRLREPTNSGQPIASQKQGQDMDHKIKQLKYKG